MHSNELYLDKIIDLRDVLKKWNIAITHQIAKELCHYKMEKFIPINEFTILPVSKVNWKKALIDYDYLNQFDKADQSLWICSVNTENIVLTDDGELLEELIQMKVKTFNLPSFIYFLVKIGKISKNMAIKCIKYWEKQQLYKKKYLTRLKKTINQI